MKARRQLALLLALPLLFGCTADDLGADGTHQISQYGITWTFDRAHRSGTFANGDFWVLGPVTITSISPDFDGAHHGWEANPSDIELQGFDERVADFDASLVASLPYLATPGESIVKAISLEPLDDGDCRPCLQTAAVLTVLASLPPDDGASVFRPPYFATDKPLHSTDELNTALLPSLAPTPGAPDLEEVEASVQRVQLGHKTGWTGRPLHPEDNMPDYYAGISGRNAGVALRLMLDDSVEDKMPALISFVQYGIDVHYMVAAGAHWSAGNHGEGRKLPPTFAGVLLDNAAMQEAVRTATRETYGENGGMSYSAVADQVLYAQTQNGEQDYWTNLVFDTGSRTIRDPYEHIDGGHRPGGSYQFCCLSKPWKANATALRLMPELVDVWNHDDFFAYVDRWVSFGAWTQPDPCAPPYGICADSDNDGAPCTSASESDVCAGEDGHCDVTGSWDAGYGVTYGPDGSGGCIADTDPSDGIGRFPQLHSTNANDGHWGNGFADEMWSSYLE